MVVVERASLVNGLEMAKRLTKRAPIHIWTHVKVWNDGGTIRMDAQNGKVSISYVIGRGLDGLDDVLTLPIDQVLGWLKGIPKGIYDVGLEYGRIVLGDYSMPVSHVDYDMITAPMVVDMDMDVVELSGDDIRSMKRVSYAMSGDDSRFNLDSVCIHSGNIVATDGKRMDIAPFTNMGDDKVVVPSNVVTLVVGMFDGVCNWQRMGDRVVMWNREWTISYELRNDYPDYWRVRVDISQSIGVLEVDRRVAISALKPMKALLDMKRGDRAIMLDVNGDMKISRGSSGVTIPLVKRATKANKALVDWKYLMDALMASKDMVAEIRFYEGSKSLITVRSDNQDSIVMLMRG